MRFGHYIITKAKSLREYNCGLEKGKHVRYLGFYQDADAKRRFYQWEELREGRWVDIGAPFKISFDDPEAE